MQNSSAQNAPADKPRLLLIAPFFFPKFYGGAVKVYDELFSRLKGFDVTVLAEQQGADPARVEEFDRTCEQRRGYRVVRLPRLSLHFTGSSPLANLLDAGRYFFSTRRAFKKLLRTLRPQVVICGATFQAGWLMHDLPPGVIGLNYIHGEELTQQFNTGPMGRWLRRAQLEAARRVHANIAVSQATGQVLRQAAGVPSEKIVVFPNFIDVKHFVPPADRDAVRERLGWTGHTVLLTLARLIARKGIDQVLRALHQLDQAGRLPADWLYVIAGKGELAQPLADLTAELGLTDRVRFAGFVPDQEVPGLYGAADLYIQTNREIQGDTEGFGIVFLEANACGTAVIGGQAGGTGDAIEHGVSGLRVDGDNVNEVAGAIEKLLGSPQLRAQMAVDGQRRAVKEFSVDVCAPRFEALLMAFVAQARGGAVR